MREYLETLLFDTGFIWILTAVWILWELDAIPWSNQITRYVQNEQCVGEHCVWTNADAVTYMIHKERQQVTYVAVNELFREENCIVHDTRNWTCIDHTIGVRFGFLDGEWFSYGATVQQRNVWKTHWWWSDLTAESKSQYSDLPNPSKELEPWEKDWSTNRQ